MIAFERSEALRYLGYHGTQPDAAVEQAIDRCAEELQSAAIPKSVFRAFELTHLAEGTMKLGGVLIRSKNLDVYKRQM